MELLVVLTLMTAILALSAPFTSSIRSDVAMRKTLRQVKTDIVTNLGYSLSGKSIAALNSSDLMNPELIPSHYALYFEKSEEFGDMSYKYLEVRSSEIYSGKNESGVLYSLEKELPSHTVYLSGITIGKKDKTDQNEAEHACIFFIPPFGKIFITDDCDDLINGNKASYDLTEKFKEAESNSKIELHFQYKENEETKTTLSFNNEKIINID